MMMLYVKDDNDVEYWINVEQIAHIVKLPDEKQDATDITLSSGDIVRANVNVEKLAQWLGGGMVWNVSGI